MGETLFQPPAGRLKLHDAVRPGFSAWLVAGILIPDD